MPPQKILILINKSHTKMNRLFRKTIVALLAIVWSASSLQAQEVNMSRYITLTVKQGTTVHFDIWADAPNTPIKVISGDKEREITAGTEWTSIKNYIAGAGTMTIYGNVQKFDCDENKEKIVGVDLTHNTKLTELGCSGNRIATLDVSQSTQLEALYCSGNRLAALDVSKNTQLKSLNCFDNSLAALDVSKNTLLSYLNCGINSITTLDVSHNTELTNLYCHSNRIASLDVSKNTKLVQLHCFENSIASLDLSRNTALTLLYCYKNALTSLDLRHNTNVERLICFENSLASLDVSNSKQLTLLNCHTNRLTLLDLSHNAKLGKLSCYKNALTSLDMSNNPELEWIYCFENPLAEFKLRNNMRLRSLHCYDSKLTTADLDDLFCSLPNRNGQSEGKISILFNTSSPENAKVLATNGKNAVAKNWTVQYYEDKSVIKGFTGNHQCTTSGLDDIKNTQDISVYPNPVEDVLNITSDKPVHSIRLYNVYGTEVLRAADTNSVDVSHLPAGVYMVRADGKVVRVIKK